MTEINEDAQVVIHVQVTNPAGVTFNAVLIGDGFSKAGVVSFYVEDWAAPSDEESGERCEAYRVIPTGMFDPTPIRPVYKVVGVEL